MLQKLNHQPDPSNMNNWTISRRVIAGFAAMLLIIVTLGAFALWRLMGLAEDIAYVADNSVPSILTLREAANISRDNWSCCCKSTPPTRLIETQCWNRKFLPTGHAGTS